MSKIKVVSLKNLTADAEPNSSEPKTAKTKKTTKSKPPKESEPSTSTGAGAAKKKTPGGLTLIIEGIRNMNDRKGATLAALRKFVISDKENLSEQQVRATNNRTLRTVKQAVEDGILIEKGKLRYGLSDQHKAELKTEEKKAVRAAKQKEKDAIKSKASDRVGGKSKKLENKVSAEKKKPLIKGPKARKSLAKVAEMNKARKSTVVVLPKKTSSKRKVKE